MKLLAIETATDACSAALLIDGAIHSRFEIAPRRHAELILPMCDSLLTEAGLAPAELDAIAFGRGPGAFTGVRIAAGVAQGIAFGLDLPVVPISTLAAMAQEIMSETDHTRVLAAIDARMGEIYWGYYERDDEGCARLSGQEHVGKPDRVEQPAEFSWFGVGGGWSAHGEALIARLGDRQIGCDAQRLPRAEYVARLAERAFRAGLTVPAERAQPIYLRDEVAKKSHEL